MTKCGDAPLRGGRLDDEVPTWDDLTGRIDDLRATLGSADDGVRTSDPAALRGIADRMARLFRLGSPDAPGLAFVGGTADPAIYGLEGFPPSSVSGRGLELRSALFGCLGEAVEGLSRLQWGNEPLERFGGSLAPAMRPETACALHEGLSESGDQSVLPAIRLGDGAWTVVPAARCLTMAGRDGSGPSSSGCAAGPSLDHARLAAVLELVERDAAALWWKGGRPARPLSAEAMSAVAVTISSLRSDVTGRRTWLLDITTDVGIPCMAAVSVGRDGRGFACGLAARVAIVEAVEAALLELCQMELANRLVQLKLRQGGPSALAPVEQRHRCRMSIDCEAAPILFPQGLPRAGDDHPQFGSAAGRLDAVVGKLAEHGIECFCVDLTRDAIGVPAVRVLAPMLQGLTGQVRSARLDGILADRSTAREILDVELI